LSNEKQIGGTLSELTYQFHNELSEKVWKNGKIKEDVKTKLLDISYLWMSEAELPENVIKDIVITGSHAGYNYTPYSDIDIHIIIDKRKLGCENLIDDFLFDKKKIFGEKHNITINDTDVEVYAQDMHEEYPKNEAVYSILNNKWIVKPSKEKKELTDPKLVKKARFYKRLVKRLMKEGNVKKMIKFKEKLRKMRQAGLNREGEFSTENIVYKELRNRNLLKSLDTRLNYLIDKRFSI
jgi:predicted nucleotidyltransferase